MAIRKKSVTQDEAIRKIHHYCAYQERSHEEVRRKLMQLGQKGEAAESIIAALVTDGFLNESRFAQAFAGGKFRMKQWGRLKITKALEQKGVSKSCIRIGLKEIPEADYRHTLQLLLSRKLSKGPDSDSFGERNKAALYAIQKGFEPELVWDVIRSLD